MAISDDKLDFWIKNRFNVLLRGSRGVGKSAMIIDSFSRNFGRNYLYFSAATLDPWVDFVGVPKERIDSNGKHYLDLVRPKHFEDDTIEAIFLDEYNRAPKKVRNAVMELIQFKSINGKKLNNLKIVWAAINPEDDEDEKYDVEPLDPAQLDRFQIHYDVPYNVHAPFFKNKFGEQGETAVLWWRDLGDKEKKLLSPRRLEYVLDMHKVDGDIRDVLPEGINPAKLLLELKSGSTVKKVKDLFDRQDVSASKVFIRNENNYNASIETILKSTEYMNFFVHLMTNEKINVLINKNEKVKDIVFNNVERHESLIRDLAVANTNTKLSGFAKQILKRYDEEKLLSQKTTAIPTSNKNTYFNSGTSASSFKKALSQETFKLENTYHKKTAYDFFMRELPKDMDIESAKKTLTILTEIANGSQTSTVTMSLTKLIPMINHTILFLQDMGASSPLSENDVLNLSRKYGTSFVLKPKTAMNDNEDLMNWKKEHD